LSPMGNLYDVIIVGGGPAGLSAGIYCVRKMLKTLVISKDIGGQVVLTGSIENYLGYRNKNGVELAGIFEAQVRDLETSILTGEVERIEQDGGEFLVKTQDSEFRSRAVIVTGGSSYKMLGVPGEEELLGRGVSVCATCDGPFARGRVAAVVGGGNAAFQSAELLAKYAKKVYIIHRRQSFRCDEILLERMKRVANVELVTDKGVVEITGSKKVDGIVLTDTKTDARSRIDLDMVFVEIGRTIKIDYAKHLVETNKIGQIIVDREQKASRKGIFAAGDITDRKYGQAIIAAGDGAVAALSAYDYIRELSCQILR
jgi:thioredoxin-disulfide reductase